VRTKNDWIKHQAQEQPNATPALTQPSMPKTYYQQAQRVMAAEACPDDRRDINYTQIAWRRARLPGYVRPRISPAKEKTSAMLLKAMNSLDIVEAMIRIEEIFGTDIPSGRAENFGSRGEIVDWLESHLSNQRPDKKAGVFLRKLARTQDKPELAEGLEGTRRREQIGAIVRESFASERT
jgi:acyl carrier protein